MKPLDLRLSPSGPSRGFAVGEWLPIPGATYSTLDALGDIGNGNIAAMYRLEGDAIRVQCLVLFGTTSVVGGSGQNVPLPPGVAIDPTKSTTWLLAGVGVWPITALSTLALAPGLVGVEALGAMVATPINGAAAFAAGDGYLFDCLLPLLR